MLPLLKLGTDGKDHRLHDAIETLANDFQLTAEERNELLPSGLQARFDNRVGWARTALKKAGLLDAPKRSFFRITDRGRSTILSGVDAIGDKYLSQFPEYLEYKGLNDKGLPVKQSTAVQLKASEVDTPRERLEAAYSELNKVQASDLLSKVKATSPSFFEKLVVQLLVKMGYGGSLLDAGQCNWWIWRRRSGRRY
jgi:restriction system protein